MTSWVMLDTNMVSYIVKQISPAARRRLKELPVSKAACVSAITKGELIYGLSRRPQSRGRIESITLLLNAVEILPWGSREATVYGDLRARQEIIGKPFADIDMLIAAHAVAVDATLVTADQAFSQVEGLRAIENWATDLA